jgi:hypothetical protein
LVEKLQSVRNYQKLMPVGSNTPKHSRQGNRCEVLRSSLGGISRFLLIVDDRGRLSTTKEATVLSNRRLLYRGIANARVRFGPSCFFIGSRHGSVKKERKKGAKNLCNEQNDVGAAGDFITGDGGA